MILLTLVDDKSEATDVIDEGKLTLYNMNEGNLDKLEVQDTLNVELYSHVWQNRCY